MRALRRCSHQSTAFYRGLLRVLTQNFVLFSLTLARATLNNFHLSIKRVAAMDKEALLTLAADIVSAHVSNNTLRSDELPGLIGSVFAALDGLGKPMPVAEDKPVPAVSVRSSIKPDSITCLDCGFKGQMLKRHIAKDHGLTPAEYKARWNLPASYPLVAPDYAERRRVLAASIGLGRKPGQKKARQEAAVAPTQ